MNSEADTVHPEDLEAGADMYDKLVDGTLYTDQQAAVEWMRANPEEREKLDKKSLKKAEKEFYDTLDYALQAPIIHHPMGPIPDMIVQQATIYRLLEAAECMEKKMATGFEAMGYISSASLIGPIGRDLTDVMEYLFRKYMPEGAEKMGIDESPTNKELDMYREGILNNLRSWLFKKQVQYLKEKSKQLKKDQPAEEPHSIPKAQFTMEDFT